MTVELTRDQIWAILNQIKTADLEKNADLKRAFFILSGQVTDNA